MAGCRGIADPLESEKVLNSKDYDQECSDEVEGTFLGYPGHFGSFADGRCGIWLNLCLFSPI
jgi:hypothetical protein